MQQRVERIVKLRIFELMVEHEDEETVEGEDGGETVAAAARLRSASAPLERSREVFCKP